eukprot:Clim_evm8s208 gene=Clim_evmTU8s208
MIYGFLFVVALSAMLGTECKAEGCALNQWTSLASGAPCYFDHGLDCATCAPGGCQCGPGKGNVCVECGKSEHCDHEPVCFPGLEETSTSASTDQQTTTSFTSTSTNEQTTTTSGATSTSGSTDEQTTTAEGDSCTLNSWTVSTSGTPCWDNSGQDCATCAVGGCQCGSGKAALCVECGTDHCHTENPCVDGFISTTPTSTSTSTNEQTTTTSGATSTSSGSDQQTTTADEDSCTLNSWTVSTSGTPCWDNSGQDCATCAAGGCQCGSGRTVLCVECGTDHCQTEDACVDGTIFPAPASSSDPQEASPPDGPFDPPSLYEGGTKSLADDYGGTRVRSLPSYKNWHINYANWNHVDPALHQFHLVIVHHTSFWGSEAEMSVVLEQIQVGADGVKGTEDDVAVLMYVSISEQAPASPKAANGHLIAGDGSGPVHFANGERQYAHAGVAPFYIDKEPDGNIDTHGTWGGYYIDCRDQQWRSIILDEVNHWVNDLGFDGIFLDAPEVGDPWHGRGWAAEGVLDIVRDLDNAFPSSLFLLNRGLFYFVPHYSYQFDFNPAKYVDFVLFESFYAGSDYGSNEYKKSPYYLENRNFMLPKVLAEFSRPDTYAVVLQLDYWKTPSNAPNTAIFDDYMDDVSKFGTLPFITDIQLSKSSNVAAESLPSDTVGPTWSNTSNGVSHCNSQAAFFHYKGAPQNAGQPARTGVQNLIPSGDNGLTVQWDLAIDQTRPLRYNVYVSRADSNMNFSSSNQVVNDSKSDSHTLDSASVDTLSGGMTLVFPDIGSGMPANYKGTDFTCGGRTFLQGEEVYPFEWSLFNLPSGTYHVVIRAEDGTSGATVTSGRRGYNGGIEEENTVTRSITI